ncbi:DUF1796 family putative cysteine peptidase [Sphingobium boeckii]|uniref:Papain-like cysteine peptidase n=1 Tax=Sphingobium boeckii TaxID=1082345 RepID=A0A7W9AK48_9SPHN|nr:hypothetical protein [Sphingobium boeckii]
MTRFISLGRHCQAAHQIDRVTGPGRPAQFFDWLITPHEGLIALLKGGFGGFLAPHNLRSQGEHEGFHAVTDAAFGVEMLHDFPFDARIDVRLAGVQAKYAHLAQRFLTLPGGRECVFMRQVEAFDPIQAGAIFAVLGQWFKPGFRLAILADSEIADQPVMPDIRVVHVPQPAPYVWKGSDPAWDKAFKALE